MNWQSIAQAPKDRPQLLVNDTNEGAAPWASAVWIECPEWSGWAYEDELLNDAHHLGPLPTHFLDVPPVPR